MRVVRMTENAHAARLPGSSRPVAAVLGDAAIPTAVGAPILRAGSTDDEEDIEPWIRWW
jgi:hypothetical protein